MLRFLFNFIFFGLLFFIIWQFFPDFFQKLVAWATAVVQFIENLVTMLIEKVNSMSGHPSTPPPEKPAAPPSAANLFWLASLYSRSFTLRPRGTIKDLDWWENHYN